MRLVIEINLDNAAMRDRGVDEVDEILYHLCEQLPDLRDTEWDLTLLDSNGDRVGRARIEG